MRKRHAGFTFIEIIVVVIIISVMATAGFVVYQGAIRSARDQRRKADIEQIRSAIELYRSDNELNSYPGDGQINIDCSPDPVSIESGGNTYLSNVPTDPLCDEYSYVYEAYNSSGGNCPDNSTVACTSYELGTRLEEGGDVCSSGLNCGSDNCSYCLGPQGRKL